MKCARPPHQNPRPRTRNPYREEPVRCADVACTLEIIRGVSFISTHGPEHGPPTEFQAFSSFKKLELECDVAKDRGLVPEALQLGVERDAPFTHCAYQFVLESQLPHKTVNLIFWLVIVTNTLTVLWGS